MGCIASLMITSCTSNEDPAENNGSGSIQLGVTASAVFTKAVNESKYNNTNNYTIQILNDKGVTAVEEFTYGNAPERINLSNGFYTLKAFYGTESNASRDDFYVEGTTQFNIEGKEQQVTVVCKPTCGKVVVNFDADMATYFSNYSVTYETAALSEDGSTVVWQKDNKDPWYLKVKSEGETVKASINFTRISDNKSATVEKTYTLSPGKSWTLNISPQVNNGDLGINVSIDETTDDEEIDIEVPSEWI